MRASQIRTYPLPLGKDGLWFSIPAAARSFGVNESTVRRWVASGRLTSEKRLRRKGVWVWSGDVARLVRELNDTPRKRLPKINKRPIETDMLGARENCS